MSTPATTACRFEPPSDSFWRRIWFTPLTHLITGRVTGAVDPRRIIARAGLPLPLPAAIWRCVRAASWRSAVRAGLANRLIAQCRNQLAASASATEIAGKLNEQAALTELGLDAHIPANVFTPSLPGELWGQLTDVARHASSGTRRWASLLTLYHHCRTELAAGATSAQLAERFADSRAVASVMRRPRVRDDFLEAKLPARLARLVVDVAKRTRLWPWERDDVLRELCAHFSDGLSNGRTSDELVRAFGSERVAAKLIRRARLRNRPVAWQLWRRGWQSMALTLLMAGTFWGVLVARLYLAGSPQIPDVLEGIDAHRSTIPEANRAWPLYRAALMEHVAWKSPNQGPEVQTAMRAGPSHKSWQAVLDHLQSNEKSLSIAMQGASRPEFGYIYREPENNAWLMKQCQRTVDEVYPRNQPAFGILLPHISDLSSLSHLLLAAAHRAAENGDGASASRYLEAGIRLSDQIRQSAEFAVVEWWSRIYFSTTVQVMKGYVDSRPELFDDADLQGLQYALVAFSRRPFRLRLEQLQTPGRAVLEGLFSDDGAGNGRITVRGIEELRSWFQFAQIVPLELNDWKRRLAISEPNSTPSSSKWWSEIQRELGESALSLVVADRRETLAVAEKLWQLFEAHLDRPFWDQTESPFEIEWKRLKGSAELRQRYMPVLLAMGTFSGFAYDRTALIIAEAERDSALVALALERYRRLHGDWPAQLGELVPEFLDAVPVDPYDGQPIRYVVRAGRPVVYSVGPIGRDDTAHEPSAASRQPAGSIGDWQWLPVVVPTGE